MFKINLKDKLNILYILILLFAVYAYNFTFVYSQEEVAYLSINFFPSWDFVKTWMMLQDRFVAWFIGWVFTNSGFNSTIVLMLNLIFVSIFAYLFIRKEFATKNTFITVVFAVMINAHPGIGASFDLAINMVRMFPTAAVLAIFIASYLECTQKKFIITAVVMILISFMYQAYILNFIFAIAFCSVVRLIQQLSIENKYKDIVVDIFKNKIIPAIIILIIITILHKLYYISFIEETRYNIPTELIWSDAKALLKKSMFQSMMLATGMFNQAVGPIMVIIIFSVLISLLFIFYKQYNKNIPKMLIATLIVFGVLMITVFLSNIHVLTSDYAMEYRFMHHTVLIYLMFYYIIYVAIKQIDMKKIYAQYARYLYMFCLTMLTLHMSYFTNRQEYFLLMFDKTYENLFNRIQGHVEDVYMHSNLKKLKTYYNFKTNANDKNFINIDFTEEMKRRHIDTIPMTLQMLNYKYWLVGFRYFNLVTGSYQTLELDSKRKIDLCKKAKGMPPYPEPGSIKIIEDTIVIQLGRKADGICPSDTSDEYLSYFFYKRKPGSEFILKPKATNF